jgi:CheY-like chemotaxis protein
MMKRILLLEDNCAMRQVITETLEIIGYDVQAYGHVREGLAALNGMRTPDLIISDIRMPEIDGFEFLQNVRHHDHHASVPFILMSGSPHDENEAVRCGANAFIVKPFKHHEFEAVIERFL